jgi:hypothetical protein
MSFARRFINPSSDSGTELSVPEVRRGCYVTDGVHLYYALGPVGDSTGLVGLEDCYSLDVILVPVEELDFLEPVSFDGDGEPGGAKREGRPARGQAGDGQQAAVLGEHYSTRL